MNATLLIAFGFGWMVVAALVGLLLGARHDTHLKQLVAAAERGDLAAYHRIVDAYKWRATVHGHGMLFSLSSIAAGFALTRSDPAAVPAAAVVAALVFATVVWTISALRRLRVLMGLADLLFIAVISVVAAGIARSL